MESGLSPRGSESVPSRRWWAGRGRRRHRSGAFLTASAGARSRRVHPERCRPAAVDVRQHVHRDAVRPAGGVDPLRHLLGRELVRFSTVFGARQWLEVGVVHAAHLVDCAAEVIQAHWEDVVVLAVDVILVHKAHAGLELSP